MGHWILCTTSNMAGGAHMQTRVWLVDNRGARGRLPPSEPTLGPPQPAVRRRLYRAPR